MNFFKLLKLIKLKLIKLKLIKLKDKKIKEPKEIKISKRLNDVHACIVGDEGQWGCGENITKALGALIRHHIEPDSSMGYTRLGKAALEHPEVFGIKLTMDWKSFGYYE